MRLVGGVETSPGRVRAENQDRPILTEWVAGVADGMGGHRGGETAAQLAVTELALLRGPVARDDLVAAVHAANDRILSQSNDPSLRGMGTTLVAMVLDQGQVVLANVGDSRAYRLVGGRLEQLTRDHSLVEDLVEQGQLSAEEARTHPQRNIVTRALGIATSVDVDVFRTPAHSGDRYLLCSDGLFNEIDEAPIAAVLRDRSDPTDAARELVRMANEAGARDNVTCVVVDVVPEPSSGSGVDAGHASVGGPGAAASGQGTGHGGEPGLPAVGDRGPRGGTGTLDAAPADVDRTVTVEAAVGGAGADGRSPTRRPARRRGGAGTAGRRRSAPPSVPGAVPARRSRWAVPWRAIAYVVAVLAIAGAAVGATLWWGRSAYYVGDADGEVVIYQGRPGGVLWMEPTVAERTGIDYDELTGAAQQRLTDPPVGSRDQARRLVETLQASSATGTTATAPPSAPPVTSAPSGPSAPSPPPGAPAPPGATPGTPAPPGATPGAPTTPPTTAAVGGGG